MTLAPELIDILVCPNNGNALTMQDQCLRSNDETVYPIIAGVPWLLPSPQNSLSDWSAKLNHFNQVILSEIKSLENELPKVEGATQQRLQKLLAGKQAFLRRVSELLFPVVTAKAASKGTYDALRDKAPNTQNLLSYEANLYRDWVWGEEENGLSVDIVAEHLHGVDCNRLAILGAGAGRLALDLHDRIQPQMSVATDINPLLVMAAQHLTRGNGLSIHEFPLHPRKADYVAVEHHIVGKKKPDNFHFVFSDAAKPCFKSASFDAVVTPWLIDIQPLALHRFLRQLNQYLPVGGFWVNFGSLVFNQQRDALCYSIEEVQDIASAQGFDIQGIQEQEIPYLKSPYNAGYRQERIWTWTARKVQNVEALKNTQNLPAWLMDDKLAIPKADYLAQFSMTHRIYAQLSAEVDGKTSLNKIVKKFVRQNRMEEGEANHLIKSFFLDLYHQNKH